MEFCYSGGYYNLNSGGRMKEYILKIKYDPINEEILSISEYIEGAKATLLLNDQEIELDEEFASYVVDDVIGIT